MKWILLTALSVLLSLPTLAANELSPAARQEVETLLTELGRSDCQFYRNGSWHDGHAAEDHLRMKFEYLLKKGLVHNAEEFIEGAGTKSSLSGQPYQVKCPNQPAQPSATYLGERLRQHRVARQVPEPARALATDGKLRIGINAGNPVLAKRDERTGEVAGVSVDLGRDLAARLGVQPALVVYPTPAALLDGARKGEWDVGFAAVDPARNDLLSFTPAYMEVSLTYIVPGGSAIHSASDVDRAGVRVGVGEKNAADLQLTRMLRHAQIVRAPDTVADAVTYLREGKVDAFASNRAGLLAMQAQLPGYRLVEGRFHVVQHAIALPKAKEAAAGFVSAFVEESKASGRVAQALTRHGIAGVDVAPRAPQPSR